MLSQQVLARVLVRTNEKRKSKSWWSRKKSENGPQRAWNGAPQSSEHPSTKKKKEPKRRKETTKRGAVHCIAAN